MSKKNQNSTAIQEENIAVENLNNFNSFFNNSNMRFTHTHKGTTIFIEPNKLFTPKNKQEEETILDFAGSNASIFNGKSVITEVGSKGVVIYGADFYKSQIATLEADLNAEKEKVKQLTRQIAELEGQLKGFTNALNK